MIAPVRVLEDQEHGLRACEPVDLIDERIERALPALRGGLGRGDGGRGLREKCIELVEPVFLGCRRALDRRRVLSGR